MAFFSTRTEREREGEGREGDRVERGRVEREGEGEGGREREGREIERRREREGEREEEEGDLPSVDLSWMQNFIKVWIGEYPSSTVFIRTYNIHCPFWKVLLKKNCLSKSFRSQVLLQKTAFRNHFGSQLSPEVEFLMIYLVFSF